MKIPHAVWTRWAWIPALVLLLAYLFADSAARWEDSLRVTRSRAAEAPAPALDPNSPSGYAYGQRRLILSRNSADGYQWLMQVQQVINGHGLRIRFVDWDNAPAGREAHWSSGLVWWVAALGWIDHALTGQPMPVAVEHVAPLALPVLLAIILLLATPVLAWRFGGWAAITMSTGLVFCLPFYDSFSTGYLDHHGPVAICALFCVLLLAGGGGGWLANPAFPLETLPENQKLIAAWLPDRRKARRWFIVSAIAGAAGLWISTASQVPALMGIGIGALAGVVTRWRPATGNPAWRIDPTLWRVWGISGATASLAFYLLEYFPNHWSWRLEINHPLYALAWLGAGDLLCRAHDVPKTWKEGGRLLASAVPATLAVIALPLVIFLAKTRVFVLSDPFLWAFHEDYIGEFQPLLARLAFVFWQPILVIVTYPVAGLLMVALLLRMRGLENPWRSLVALAAGPAAITALLTLKQERWLGLACALSIAAITISVFVLQRGPAREWPRTRRILGGGALAVVLLFHAFYWPSAFLQSRIGPPPGNEIFLTVRNLSYKLRQRVGDKSAVIAGGFSITSQMIYFGGFRGLGTGYWENRDGLHDTVKILGAETDEDAKALIREHGITHIVDVSWDFYSTPSVRLLHGLRRDDPTAATGFLNRIENGEFPSWVRPVIAESGELNAMSAMIYEIDFQQSPLAALVCDARFFADLGIISRAKALLNKALALQPNAPAALIVQANLEAAEKNQPALATTMARLQEILATNPPLTADNKIDLARAWLAVSREDAAETTLASALRSLDEPTLRRLSTNQLLFLAEYSRKWALPYPTGLSADFALDLVPKALRPTPP